MSSRSSGRGGRSSPEAERWIGNAKIELSWSDRDNAYYGSVSVPVRDGRAYFGRFGRGDEFAIWEFDDLRPSPYDLSRESVDSDDMFDKMAGSAVSFGSDPGVNPELHDVIEEATAGYQDDQGNYEVRRGRPGGYIGAGKRKGKRRGPARRGVSRVSTRSERDRRWRRFPPPGRASSWTEHSSRISAGLKKPKRKKRKLTPAQRKKMLANLAKGRKKRAANLKRRH